MTNTKELMKQFEQGLHDDLLRDIYIDESRISYQRERYLKTLKDFEDTYAEADVCIFSAPGRSEIGGNHTDHQHGEVLAASINNDCIAIVEPLEDDVVKVVSDGYRMIRINLNNLELRPKESGTTLAIIKGVLKGMKDRGYAIGGFQAYITSDVLIGAGLSSSAAFETIIGTICSGLYNDMKVSPMEIAIIGQYAENEYFGKPCGLMDQMACSVGNMVHIDFADPAHPVVEKVDFDLAKHQYSLCITDTKGSHADLTPDYAAIPEEMKKVAAFFGKSYLGEVDREDLLQHLAEVRTATSDRCVLRALHFMEENIRVRKEVAALRSDDFQGFLDALEASGNSSFKYLQNVYTSSDVQHQNVSIGLAVSDIVLGSRGRSRVHGGGFAGTIQAFVPNDLVGTYRQALDQVFGKGSCSVLKIRRYGGMRVL